MEKFKKSLLVLVIGIYFPQVAWACSRVHAAVFLPFTMILFVVAIGTLLYKLHGANTGVKKILNTLFLTLLSGFFVMIVWFFYQEYTYRQELFSCRAKCPLGEVCFCEPICL